MRFFSVTLLMLSACSGSVDRTAAVAENNAEATVATDTRPSFRESRQSIEPLLRGSIDVGDVLADDSGFDGFTGGEATTITGRDGIIRIFTLPNGAVWKVRLQAGVADKCGQLDRPLVLAAGLVKRLAPRTSDDELMAIAEQLAPGMREDEMAEASFDRGRVILTSSCLQTLTATAV